MKNQYRLFYQDVEIGRVIQEDKDFPNLFGTFLPIVENDQPPLPDMIQQYIAYSIAADQLMQEGKQEEWGKFAGDNEPRFLDLIESDDWHLMDGGTVEPILIPNFCQNNGIVWRWKISPETGN